MECEIGADESVTKAIVRAVSVLENCDPLSLRPLSEVVDPDALNDLFGAQPDGTPRPGGSLALVYSDCHVTIENGEYLRLTPIRPGIWNERT